MKNSREWYDDARLRRLRDSYACKHCRLQPMTWICEHHTHLDRVRGRIERIADVRYGTVERFTRICGEEDIHGHVQMHRAKVAFEQISRHPYSLKICDRGDSICGFE